MDALNNLQKMILNPGSISYIRQQDPSGLGHAIWCARHLIQNEPFAVILADDLIFGQSTMKNMIKNYKSGNMVAIMEVDQNEVSSYGIIESHDYSSKLIEINQMIEKPSIQNSPSNLAIVGRYILDSSIFTILENQGQGSNQEIQLTDSICSQIGKVKCLGYKFEEERFDCGSKLGFVQANVAYALHRNDLNNDLSKWLKNLVE